MFDRNDHLTDRELIRLIDCELTTSTAHKARIHCSECFACRSRRLQIEQMLSEFADLYTAKINSAQPGFNATRSAELKDRLIAASQEPSMSRLGRFTQFAQHRPYLSMAAAAFVLAVVVLSHVGNSFRWQSISVRQTLRLLPDHTLTPGATRPVSVAESCSQPEADLDPAVSVSVRKRVFQEYGIEVAKNDDYQVDYLINPQLGGTNDVRNLWPEPYRSTVWNAHAKDALEDRLHRMVCDNQIDLAAAQRELATDWIAAYKKHFHAESPS